VNYSKVILLADDDKRDIELTIAALSENDLVNNVVVVNDGTEVLDYLYCRGKFENRPKGNPIVIMLDIKMPKMTGLEVLEIIKKDDTLKSIPVLILTSSREDKDLIKSYQLGANSFVVKPVKYDEFIEAVSRLGMFWALVNEAPN